MSLSLKFKYKFNDQIYSIENKTRDLGYVIWNIGIGFKNEICIYKYIILFNFVYLDLEWNIGFEFKNLIRLN